MQYKTQSQKLKINSDSTRSEHAKLKEQPHFLLFAASVTANALLDAADHDNVEISSMFKVARVATL